MIKLKDTLAIDFEDLSAGPCGDERCLYVGDIGDNAARRDAITVYRLIDPNHPGPGQTLTQRPERLILSYPDGPTDAEGLAVDPRTGDVLIISNHWPTHERCLSPRSERLGAISACCARTAGSDRLARRGARRPSDGRRDRPDRYAPLRPNLHPRTAHQARANTGRRRPSPARESPLRRGALVNARL